MVNTRPPATSAKLALYAKLWRHCSRSGAENPGIVIAPLWAGLICNATLSCACAAIGVGVGVPFGVRLGVTVTRGVGDGVAVGISVAVAVGVSVGGGAPRWTKNN